MPGRCSGHRDRETARHPTQVPKLSPNGEPEGRRVSVFLLQISILLNPCRKTLQGTGKEGVIAMKVKVPKTIKILSHTYKIRFGVKDLIAAGAMGLTRHLHQEIILDGTNIPPSELNQTLLHELMHIVERHFCLKMGDDDIDRISEGMAVVLFDAFGIELDWSGIKEG